MSDELVIKGEVEVLRLQPGDVLVVTLDTPFVAAFEQIHARIHAGLAEKFPGHEVVYVANGIRLSIAREEVPA